jgi:predicted nucleic acid-binding protein
LILLDTSGLLAALDEGQNRHEAAAAALRAASGPLVMSPFVLAELDYFVAARLGRTARGAILEQVSLGAYRLAQFAADDVAEAKAVVDGYADLGVSLADASVVVLAHRHAVADVLTLDERHFRVLPGPYGPFRLLPADA